MSLTIDQDLLHPVIAWATKHKAAFLPNFYGRAYFPFDKGRLPHFMQEIKDKVEEHYGIAKDAQQEPIYKDFVGFITNGGQVHEHRDHNHRGLIHTRFNVLVSKPEAGGEPINNGRMIDVNEGEVWRCNAGLDLHSCTKVVGNKPRIVLSFGYLL